MFSAQCRMVKPMLWSPYSIHACTNLLLERVAMEWGSVFLSRFMWRVLYTTIAHEGLLIEISYEFTKGQHSESKWLDPRLKKGTNPLTGDSEDT